MRLLLRLISLVLVAWILAAALPLLAAGRAHRLVGPPANCEVVKLQNQVCACGVAYLSAHSDTALLVPFGFRKFEFEGWSLGRARYTAVWPIDVPLDDLPIQLSDLEYNRVEASPPESDAVTEFSDLAEFERTMAIEQATYDVLESGRHGAANHRETRSRNRNIRYSFRTNHGYSRYDEPAPARRQSRAWNGIYGTVPVRVDSYSPYRSDGYGECNWDIEPYYTYSRSRRSSGYWDNSSCGSSVSFSRCRANSGNDTYQCVPWGSSTTLERTPIQNEYHDWKNSGSPFMNGNNGGNYGGIGYDPYRNRCR